jgi:hypothetical protein
MPLFVSTAPNSRAIGGRQRERVAEGVKGLIAAADGSWPGCGSVAVQPCIFAAPTSADDSPWGHGMPHSLRPARVPLPGSEFRNPTSLTLFHVTPGVTAQSNSGEAASSSAAWQHDLSRALNRAFGSLIVTPNV